MIAKHLRVSIYKKNINNLLYSLISFLVIFGNKHKNALKSYIMRIVKFKMKSVVQEKVKSLTTL